MVNFYNIKSENGIMTAHAVNTVTGFEEDVRTVESDLTTNATDDLIKRATWCLVIRYRDNRKGYPKKTSVMW